MCEITRFHRGSFRVKYGKNSSHFKIFTLTPLVALATNMRYAAELRKDTTTKSINQVLDKHLQELEEKLANPVGEIKVEFKEVQADIRKVYFEVGELNKKMTEEKAKMGDQISQILHIVITADSK